jgi:hypothetical protein
MLRSLSGLLLLTLTAAHAWDPVGHMVVNQTAWDHLTPGTRAAMEQSLAAFNAKEGTSYDFVSAGCWMDDIRSRTKEYNTWHYIELPYNAEGEPFPPPWQVNALWAITLCTDIIAGKREHPGVDRDRALVMLTHLVADVHQPLHAGGREGDMGGNRVVVPNIEDAKVAVFPNWRNLHYFWDSAYRRTVTDGKVTELIPEPPIVMSDPIPGYVAARPVIQAAAGELEKTHDATAYPATGPADQWVRESRRLGYENAYQKLPGGDASKTVELDAPYVDNARAIARQRVTQAGLRLAGLLNSLYDGSSAAPKAE